MQIAQNTSLRAQHKKRRRSRLRGSFWLCAIGEIDKPRYVNYFPTITKYLNRYNALFVTTYRNSEPMIKRLTETVLAVTCTNYYHLNKDVRLSELLVI